MRRRAIILASIAHAIIAVAALNPFASATIAVAEVVTLGEVATGDVPQAIDSGLAPSKPLTKAAAAQQRYLVETSHPGTTMTLQGPPLAISRLHPEFVARLAAAIREARESGLPAVGIFSAYRPPAFGIGGFSDKFNSLHTYGLAVDLDGIGGPGTPETKLWREVAARHGIVCPYDIESRSEWNHCQPTRVKIIPPENPLRATVSADGPTSLDAMFDVGRALIEEIEVMAASIVVELPLRAMADKDDTAARPPQQQAVLADDKKLAHVPAPATQQTLTRHGKFRSKFLVYWWQELRRSRLVSTIYDACGAERGKPQARARQTMSHRLSQLRCVAPPFLI